MPAPGPLSSRTGADLAPTGTLTWGICSQSLSLGFCYLLITSQSYHREPPPMAIKVDGAGYSPDSAFPVRMPVNVMVYGQRTLSYLCRRCRHSAILPLVVVRKRGLCSSWAAPSTCP
jgi:hypothetical protein